MDATLKEVWQVLVILMLRHELGYAQAVAELRIDRCAVPISLARRRGLSGSFGVPIRTKFGEFGCMVSRNLGEFWGFWMLHHFLFWKEVGEFGWDLYRDIPGASRARVERAFP